MKKTKITIAFLGEIPIKLDKQIISKRVSNFFIIDKIVNIPITSNADGQNWDYSDDNINGLLPINYSGDFLLTITHVPLEDNYYARRFSNNRICATLYEIADILKVSNIPIENLIYRLLYSYLLIYKRYGNRIPQQNEITNFTHDETRKCLFDMNGIKSDVIYSTNKPQLCSECLIRLKKDGITENDLNQIQKELKKINKVLYYRILDFIQQNPIWTIIISSITAIILGVIGSVIASFVYEAIKNY
ncbi:MAG: hypothetical protein JNM71_07715 [Flavobacterium lindanitolerans]|uniref:hypothetical protein n=1 Tax=Flavobacterium lindanitolerans TaxID=428988 RepID=UPI001A489AD1|nr:hypothetical protein [Flavobacterium lindanitolerans]MBL7867894.1 hypothetical protein [Flavobacterium lindanitolerans]